ncbi:MAG: CPBP family intramembrane metalloprotease [Oscillospiraceae bacterium]|nr:CPBP family intramembrane metalloprotease [Oscillospiraceae bacterium]
MNDLRRDVGALRKGELIGGLVWLALFFFGAHFVLRRVAPLLGIDLNQIGAFVSVNLIFDAVNAAVLCTLLFRFLKDQFRRLQDRGWALFPDLLLGWLVNYGLSLLVSLVISVLLVIFSVESYQNLNQEAAELLISAAPLAAIASACILAPLAEELSFRGVLFCGLYPRSRILAYAVSMLAFSLLHVLSAIPYQPVSITLINLLVYLPAGYALSWIYERSGSIWSAVFLHAALNAISLLLQGLDL